MSIKKIFLLTFLLFNFIPAQSQTWRNYTDEDGIPNREIIAKGNCYTYLNPQGIPIEAIITNNEDGYFIDLKYTWYGTNFDGPVYFHPELDMKMYIKIQNGEAYKLTKDLYYGELRINGNEQTFLDGVFKTNGKIIFIINTREAWSTKKGTDEKYVFTINSIGY